MSHKYVMTTVTTTTEKVEMEPRIPVAQWGKDHWSTFAYIECRCVDDGGKPNIKHMRCDRDLHPQFSHVPDALDKKYPTRYKGGELIDHDWSCLDDCEMAGLLENIGTGLNRVYRLTPLGRLVAAQLRQHKQDGKNFHDFTPQI
jgi:hypothetical protein